MAHSIVTWHNTPDTWVINEQVFTTTKFLVAHQSKTYNFSNGEWVDTGLSLSPTQSEYMEYGMDGLGEIPEIKWDEFGGIFDILAWTDSGEPIRLRLSVPPFRPLDKLENQFKIVAGEYMVNE